MRYSQNDEQDVIARHYAGRVGRFLDIGAFTGVELSNTRALAERGWGGVMVEPSPSVLPSLSDSVRCFDGRVEVLPYAVGRETKSVEWFDSVGDAVSTTEKWIVNKWQGAANYMLTTVDQLSVADLFARVGFDFDFISIDTEGTSVEVAELLPWGDLARVDLVCIEHDDMHERIAKLLDRIGFVEMSRNPENIIAKRRRA